jgi:replicative superfamily II helicase
MYNRESSPQTRQALIQANSLINSMLEDNTIGELGTLVLDEMHMIGDPHRGYIMELVVTKVLAIQLPVQVVVSWSFL